MTTLYLMDMRIPTSRGGRIERRVVVSADSKEAAIEVLRRVYPEAEEYKVLGESRADLISISYSVVTQGIHKKAEV